MGKPPTVSRLVSAGHCPEVPEQGGSWLMSGGRPVLGTEGMSPRMNGSRRFPQEIRGLHGRDLANLLD